MLERRAPPGLGIGTIGRRIPSGKPDDLAPDDPTEDVGGGNADDEEEPDDDEDEGRDEALFISRSASL